MSSLLVTKRNIELDFSINEEPKIYAANGGNVLIINTKLEYKLNNIYKSGLSYSGKLPEEMNDKSYLYLDDEHWFQFLNELEMIYYSFSENTFKFYNFKEKNVTQVFKHKLQFDSDHFHIFQISYIAWSKKVTVVTQKYNESEVKVFQIYLETGDYKECGTAILNNLSLNCIYITKSVLFFTNNSLSDKNFRIYFVSDKGLHKINIPITNSEDFLEFGFLDQKLTKLFIIYSNLNKKYGGIYIYNIGDFQYDSDLDLEPQQDNFQEVRLMDSNNYQYLDGGYIIDRNLSTICITSLSHITLYQIQENDGVVNLEKIHSLEINKDSLYDQISIDKTALVGSNFDKKNNMLKTIFYSSLSINCLYFWLMDKVGILNEYKPAVCKEVIKKLK